jgi:hypothetical protein
MANLNTCVECRGDGSLVLCDGCPRSFHPKCFGKEINPGDFFCGKCKEEIPKDILEQDDEHEDISEGFKSIKKGCREEYREKREEFERRPRYRISSSRNASSNPRIRKQLLMDQRGYCAGLLMANGHYRRCDFKATDCDHIIELRHGGYDRIEFLQMLCTRCHRTKTRLNRFRQTTW